MQSRNRATDTENKLMDTRRGRAGGMSWRPGLTETHRVHARVLSCFCCVRLCDPGDCSLPGSSVQGILQARVLEWVSSASPALQADSLPTETLGKPICTPLCTKQITNEDLLCSAGNSAQRCGGLNENALLERGLCAQLLHLAVRQKRTLDCRAAMLQ